eukprot:scaffold4141_cov199-Chaetoceros_neogracile.AAC.3
MEQGSKFFPSKLLITLPPSLGVPAPLPATCTDSCREEECGVVEEAFGVLHQKAKSDGVASFSRASWPHKLEKTLGLGIKIWIRTPISDILDRYTLFV